MHTPPPAAAAAALPALFEAFDQLATMVATVAPDGRCLQANAALAGVTPAQRRQSVAEAGKMVLESLRLWLRPGRPHQD